MDGSTWERLLERFGQKVTLYQAGLGSDVKAFFQPVGERSAGE